MDFTTPNTPINLEHLGREDFGPDFIEKNFDSIDEAINYLQNQKRNHLDNMSKEEKFDNLILKFRFDHTQYDDIGMFINYCMYNYEKMTNWRTNDRCFGYNHNGGSHTLTINVNLNELKEYYEYLKPYINKFKEANKEVEIIEKAFELRLNEIETMKQEYLEGTRHITDANVYFKDFWNLEKEYLSIKN